MCSSAEIVVWWSNVSARWQPCRRNIIVKKYVTTWALEVLACANSSCPEIWQHRFHSTCSELASGVSVWAPYGYIFLWHLSQLCLVFSIGKLHVMLFPCSRWIGWTEDNAIHHNMSRTSCNTTVSSSEMLSYFTLITTARELGFIFKEQDTSTPALQQTCRTQSGLSGNDLSTRSQHFIAAFSFSWTSHPLFHLLIMTALQCVCAGVCRWERACWSILLLFTNFLVLAVSLFSCATHGLQFAFLRLRSKQPHLTNLGMFTEWNEAIKLISDHFFLIFQQIWNVICEALTVCLNISILC